MTEPSLKNCRFRVILRLNNMKDLRLVWQDYASKWERLIVGFLENKIREWSVANHFVEGGDFNLSGIDKFTWHRQCFNHLLHIVADNGGIIEQGTEITLDADSAIEISEFHVEFVDDVTISHSCLALAWLLQGEGVIDGVPEHLFALRRCIIYEILDEALKSSWVTVDKVELQRILEEWLVVELKENQDLNRRDDYAFTKVKLPWGRSSGFIATGPRGVGKTAFCRVFIHTLMTVAPWLVNVVQYPESEEMPVKEETARKNSRESFEPAESGNIDSEPLEFPSKYFDGGKFVVNAKGNDYSMTVPKFFASLRQGAKLGKISVTLLDNFDLILSGKDSDQYLRQIYFHLGRIDFEYFIFCTSAATGMVKDTMIMAPYPSILMQFPIIKVYDLSLPRRCDFIKKTVSEMKGLAFQPHVVEKVRSLASQPEYLSDEERTALYNRLHNMSISDLRRVAFSVAITMAQEVINTNPHSAAKITFSEGLRRVLSSRIIYEGLAPAVTGSIEWVFDDLVYSPAIESVVDSIVHSFKKHNKVIHFVRLESDQALLNANFERNLIRRQIKGYGKLSIPQNSVYSLLHHLHNRLKFRSSFQLSGPNQLLPHASFHSAVIPYSSINPFNEFYWSHKKSVIVVNDLDTLVGFQEEFSKASVIAQGYHVGQSSNVGQGSSRGQSIGLSSGHDFPFSTGTTQGNVNMDNIMFGLNNVSGVDVNIGTTFGGGASFGNSWNAEIAKAYQLVNSKSTGRGYGTNAGLSYGVFAGQSYSQSKDQAYIDLNISGDQARMSYIIRHPESCSKLVMGLKQIASASVRDINPISNIIVIFYKKQNCYEEVITKKLCWSLDGEYYPNRIGCRHFRNHVDLKFDCCDDYYSCLQCHQEKAGHVASEIASCKCLYCYKEFKPTKENGKKCVRCCRDLAAYFCFTCKLWHHQSEFSHCERCNKCFSADYIKFHKELCES